MQFEYSLFVVPLALCTLISLFVFIYAWSRRSNQSAIALSILALVIAQWTFSYALEIAAVDLAGKYFWGKLQYIGIATVPLFWLIFAYNHTNPGKRMPHRWMLALSAIPVITILLALTMEWHSLIWGDAEVLCEELFSAIQINSRGSWFYVHFAYSYLMLLAGSVIILLWLRRVQGLYRGQAAALIFSLIVPWVGNILYFLGVNPDPTPFAFTITLLGLLWAIFGYRLVDVAPVARDLVVDGMRDGMLVLDASGKVADINPAAARMIGLPQSSVLGKSADEVLSPWPKLLEIFRNSWDANEQITVGQGMTERHYEIRISALSDRSGNVLGRLVTVRDLDQSAPPARSAIQEPTTRPLPKETPPVLVAQDALANPVWRWLKNFFSPPLLSRAFMPDNLNPTWAQTIERTITTIARFTIVFGSATALITLSDFEIWNSPGYVIAMLLFLAIAWYLALVRTSSFNIRVGLFLFLVYTMAFAEMLKHGFSAEVFLYFLALIVLALLLLNLRGGFWMLALALVTLGTFGWAVLSGTFMPTESANSGIVLPANMNSAVTSIVVYLLCSLSIISVVNMFMINLNQAWQKETQALNLVQQERDLLEQRVVARTIDLAHARDLAVQSSNELRKYFLAIEQSGNTIVITDLEGNIEYANPQFEQSTGYRLEEARGKNPRILKSGLQTAEFYKDMWQTISSGKIWNGELYNKRKDGSLFWESATIAPVQNRDGVISNYVAVKEDITAAKQLREQIRSQNDYLSILHQTTIALLDRQELGDLLNAAVEKACILLDAPLGEIMLKEDEYMVVRAFSKNQPYLLGDRVDRSQAKLTWQAHDTRHPAVLDDYSAWVGRRDIYDANPLHAVANFPIMVGDECIGVLAMGRTRPGYVFTSTQTEIGVQFARMLSLVLDNVNLYQSALREIEQRKFAEEQNLRFLDDMKSMQEISLALSQVETLGELYVQMIDLSQRRLGLDRVALFLVDDVKNEIVGTFGVTTDGLVRDESYYREPITVDHWTLEIANAFNHTKLWDDAPLYYDSEVVGYGWKASTALWNGHQPIGYLVCDTFLTRKPVRPYETELISLLGNTFGHLIERKRAEQQLAIARDQALDASRFKTQLLAKVSHELRTPLGAVFGYAELLQRHLFGPLNDEQQDAADNIVDSASYLNTMISELLDQAQIEARSIQLRILPFSPSELVERVVVTMNVLAEKKGLSLTHSVAPDLPESLMGDSKRLQQILINLTGNAIKFTTEGTVHIDLLRPDQQHWAMRVSDTGAGIPKEAHEYIFEPFRQVDNAITNYNRGTGLGLSITKQLVELMDGQIILESEVEKGSTFTITFPIQGA